MFSLLSITVFGIVSCGKTITIDETVENTEIKKTEVINTDSDKKATDNILTYTNSDEKIMVNYPKDWHVEEWAFSAIVRFLPPQMEGDLYREEIVIDSYELENDSNLNIYTEQAIELLQQGLVDFVKLNEKNIKINNEKAVKITFQGKRWKWNNQYQQVYLVKENKVFVLTYTALENTFDIYAEEFAKFVDSFELIE